MRPLSVWMNGRYVGAWQQVRGGRDRFSYARGWLSDPRSRALSLSLPMTSDAEITSDAVGYYFDNLLPDTQGIRDRIRTRFSTRSASTFDLLEAIGRDCVGAVQLLPQGTEPSGWHTLNVERLKPKEIEAILRAVPTSSAPLLNRADEGGDFRISLAGAQEKTALTKIGRHWYKPSGSTPTTHILKLPLGLVGNRRLDLSHSVDNEWLCAQLLKELGLPVASTDIGQFGDQRALIVERFDRRWQNVGDGDPHAGNFVPLKDTWIARLPQEDFCQVTARPHTATSWTCSRAPKVPPQISASSCWRSWYSGCLQQSMGTPRTSRYTTIAEEPSASLRSMTSCRLGPWSASVPINSTFTSSDLRWPFGARTRTIKLSRSSRDTSEPSPMNIRMRRPGRQ